MQNPSSRKRVKNRHLAAQDDFLLAGNLSGQKTSKGVKSGMASEQTELLERLRQRDEDAFAELVRTYQDRIVNMIYRMLHNYDDAVEAAQEVFLKAFRAIDKFEGKSQVYTWLCRIAMNTATSIRRSKRRRTEEAMLSLDAPVAGREEPIKREIASSGVGPAENAERRELGKAVHGAIERLEEDFRAVVVLKDIEGFGYGEISEILSIPRGTVKSRLHRARLMLRDLLQGIVG